MDEFEEMTPIMYYPATYKSSLDTGCPYNKGVVCEDKDSCISCGWNPVVDKARRAKTREKLIKEWLSSE